MRGCSLGELDQAESGIFNEETFREWIDRAISESGWAFTDKEAEAISGDHRNPIAAISEAE